MATVNTATNYIEFWNALWDLRDTRVDGWLGMSSIWPTIIASCTYWYICMVLGPALMKDRPAFTLKNPIQVYNVLIVALSTYGFVEAFLNGWGSHYNWICQPIEYDTDPDSKAMRMAAMCHVYYLSKFIEFSDTFIMIARKKFGQVNRLQLIHHGVMPIYTFFLVRWVPGGHGTFAAMLNSFVHMIMYSYYFLAALGPHMQKYLWWKKYLTTFQMGQFVAIFIKSLVVVLGFSNCGYPWYFSFTTAALMILMFILFAEFYINEYTRKKLAKPNINKVD